MVKQDNYYEFIGVSPQASAMEITRAYRALLKKWESEGDPADPQFATRKQQLEQANATLQNPALRKKHDEHLAWLEARSRLDADKAKHLAQRLKDEQEAEKRATAAATQRAATEAKRAREAAEAQAELDRINAEAEARFRQLREERLPFADTQPVMDKADDDEPEPDAEELVQPAPIPAKGRIPKKVVLAGGAGAALLLLLVVFLVLRPGNKAPAAATTPPVAEIAAAAASVEPAASAPQAAAEPAQGQASDPAVAKVAPKPSKAKPLSPEAQQYLEALKRVEAAHPELNPKHAAYRPDLVAFVASRMKVHAKAGYTQPRALEVAVRDLETQDQINRAIAQHKVQKESATPEKPVVADKGGHSGFDAKCRWLNSMEWSCK